MQPLLGKPIIFMFWGNVSSPLHTHMYEKTISLFMRLAKNTFDPKAGGSLKLSSIMQTTSSFKWRNGWSVSKENKTRYLLISNIQFSILNVFRCSWQSKVKNWLSLIKLVFTYGNYVDSLESLLQTLVHDKSKEMFKNYFLWFEKFSVKFVISG